MKMLGSVREMQAKMKEAQENLVHIRAEAESGGGMVKVTVNGSKQVIKLEIDKDLAKPEDLEMMQDLIIAAVNKAIVAVEEKCQESIKKQTEGMMPNIPGFDLGSLKI